MKPSIYVLVGVPGSGKSTWTDNFLGTTDLPFVVVSSDMVLDAIAKEKGLTYSDVFSEFIDFATSKAKQTFRDAIVEGTSIIYDQTNLSKKKRKGILQQTPKNYHKVAVVFDTDAEEVERRLVMREQATGKHISKKLLSDMYSRWETPTVDEGFDVIIKVSSHP